MSEFVCNYLGDDGNCFNLLCGCDKCPKETSCTFRKTDKVSPANLDKLIQKIKERRDVTIPEDATTLDDLRFWISGYIQCQKDIVKILEEER